MSHSSPSVLLEVESSEAVVVEGIVGNVAAVVVNLVAHQELQEY